MPELSNNRGLLAKNAEIREEMLRREHVSTNDFFNIDGKEEYQDTFTKNNKLEDNASLLYANLLSLNAYINKDRFLEQKYITPSLTEFYGSNPQIDGNIGYYNIFNAHNGTYHKETGRIVDDYNEGVHFIEIENSNKSLKELEEENGGIYYLQQNIERAKRYYNSEEHKSRKTTYSWNEPYTRDYVSHDDSEPFENEEKLTPRDIDEEQTIRNGDGLFSAKNVEDALYNRTVREAGLFKATKSLFEANLLKTTLNTRSKNLKKKNSDAYVRNWSKYKEYNESFVKNLAGNYKSEDGVSLLSISDIQEGYDAFRAKGDNTYLQQNTVLSNTGFVNIVNRNERKFRHSEDLFDKKGKKVGRVDSETLKKCMLSIENLAWKDVPHSQSYLSSEQRGPNGGRIMWFPPYDISFDESVNTNWSDNTFIGRGEKVYTYTNTERTGTLSFTLLIDHPNVLNHIDKNNTPQDDVLRFFNGEQLLQVKKQEEIMYEVQEPIVCNEVSIAEELPKEKKEINFSIYFPENYSGLYIADDIEGINVLEYSRNRKFYIDRDWWLYLLIGSDTNIEHWDEENDEWDGEAIPAWPVPEWRGYEITRNGLNLNVDAPDVGITPVVNNKMLTAWNSVYNRSNNDVLRDEQYKFRVDCDMIARQNKPEYYYDLGSLNFLNGQVIPIGEEINEHDSDGTNFSFLDAATAIAIFYNEQKYSILKNYAVGGAGSLEERIEEIKNYLEKLDIEEISIHGCASQSEGGKNPENEGRNALTIAYRRSVIVEEFLKDFLKSKDVSGKITKQTVETVPCNDENPLSEEQKRARRVDVTISFKATDITKLSDTANGATGTPEDTGTTGGGVTITDNPGGDTLPVEKEKDIPDEDIDPNKIILPSNEYFQRYENEASYFERITEEKSLAYDKITEKIKYFNPAFHSMSPEGFNARLTFLQQCMRQGHTIEVSDKNGFASTAGNLAFGRMPVCVLTLGDFICSRIIINSASIQYSDDGMQWDLNKTGAGVQPMFAKVTLQIVLLGGQSLGGPISRLQNAVSFNYYANTGVYDDRADRYNSLHNEKYMKDAETGYYTKTDEYTNEIEGDRPWAPYPKK